MAERLTVDQKVASSRLVGHPFFMPKRNRFVSGVPVGTAKNRLRKLVMFNLLKRLAENICYRCGKPIESADELSIDHKNSWIENHESFWDINNIAFSHFLCNSLAGDRRRPGDKIKQRKIGSEGTVWCQGHQAFLPIENFYNRIDHWNGKDPYCKDCKRRQASSRKR